MNNKLMNDDKNYYESQLRALSLWEEQRFEPITPKNGGESARKTKRREIAIMRSKANLLGCIGHMLVLNTLIDGTFVKALVYSYFENHYHEDTAPLPIFRFIRNNFSNLSDSRCQPCRFSRGRWVLQLLRCLHLNKGTSQLLTMIFVCICRCYSISARIVESIHGTNNKITLFAEVFEAESGSWKRADFTNNTYDGVEYNPPRNPRNTKKEATANYAAEACSEYNGHLYVQRSNKLFVYRKGENLTVVAILVSKSELNGIAMLNVSEFPFEEEQMKQRLLHEKEKPGIKASLREYTYVFGCNKFGWFSELTPKYVDRYNDVCAKRGKEVSNWFIETVERLNEKHMYNPKVGLVRLLEKADAKWIDTKVNNDPLPVHKSRFKNHPIYVLASQIGNNHIKKKDATPIGFFKGEEVYVRSDLEELKSSSAWLKLNRRVIENSKPITTRMVYNKQTRMQVQSHLFSESQTVLIPQKESEQGDIPTTEYDNVDATGEKFLPKNTIYLRSRKLDLLIRTAKALNITYKRAFSSYKKEDAFKPEIDGIVIRKTDLAAFLKKYEEISTEKALSRWEEAKDSCRNYWRSVLKTMLSDPPTVAKEQHRKIRKEMEEQVSQFLNRLEHLT